jgi:hypothetical protein
MPERYDYLSPGLEPIEAARYFPDMIEGDPSSVPWEWMRKDDPHKWRCDRTMPYAGFINFDETMILYNTALQFRDQPALEIGCLFGWSAWHLASAGVKLTVVDPLLRREGVVGKVFNSLAAVNHGIEWAAQASPEALHQRRGPWDLIFIDANHDAPHPMIDAAAADHYASENALILFHDVICPDVFAAVQFLWWRKWSIKLYYTSQMMAAAWRGKVKPIVHIPDTAITRLPLSGELYREACRGL